MNNELFEAAKAVRLRAHNRYSNFAVGASIRTAAGTTHIGCNVENVAFPEGWCAETTAIGDMVVANPPGAGRGIVEVCVVADAIDGRPTTPCGGCRQRIAEFAGPDTLVHCYDPAGNGRTWRMDELIPALFAPRDEP